MTQDEDIKKGSDDLEDLSDIIKKSLIQSIEASETYNDGLTNKSINNTIQEVIQINDLKIQNEKTPKDNFVFYNVMEEIVKNKATDFIRDLSVCDCEKCYYDIVAMTLNKLPPRYVVTPKGRLFAKISVTETQINSDMASILTSACLYIDKNPRHTNLKNKEDA